MQNSGFKIVLNEPEIPQNTGNIARLCACTGSDLFLVGKLGFSLSEKHIKRAGLDYWDSVNIRQVPSLDELFEEFPNEEKYFLTTKAKQSHFPSNIKVNIKKKKSGGYVDILYPDEPTLARLKNNDIIQGLITRDISSLMESENIEDIVDDAGSLIENASIAVQTLNGIFVEIRSLISDNRNNINIAVKNLTDATYNLENMTKELNKTFSRNEINASINNIEQTTQNIKEITQQIDTTTVPIVNSTLCETYSTVRNANEITSGVKKTLKKNMGLGRLLFGKPISKDCD